MLLELMRNVLAKCFFDGLLILDDDFLFKLEVLLLFDLHFNLDIPVLNKPIVEKQYCAWHDLRIGHDALPGSLPIGRIHSVTRRGLVKDRPE